MNKTATSPQTRTRINDSENDFETMKRNEDRSNSNTSGNQTNGSQDSRTSKMNGNGNSSEGKTSRLGNDGNSSSKTSSSQNGKNKSGLESSQLMKLFEAELKDIYWAEKEMSKAIPKMVENATSAELIKALKMHLGETQEHVKRLEDVFEAIGKKPSARKCESMAGLIKEAEEIMEECDEGPMCDAGIIAAAQKIEHYEIATYGTLRQFAETLGLKDAEKFLAKTLNQEKESDVKLTEIAVSVVNMEAAEEPAGSKK